MAKVFKAAGNVIRQYIMESVNFGMTVRIGLLGNGENYDLFEKHSENI